MVMRFASLLFAGWCFASLVPGTTVAQTPPIRDLTFARDGRLAASIDGDLWVRSGANSWRRITSGAAWDRQPAWTPDGSALVFTSNRDGQDDIWRVTLDGNVAPVRVTTDPLPDGEPAVAPDGAVVFVRGRLNEARLWQRSTSGEEKRVTTGTTPERSPVFAPSGNRFAYIQQFDGGRRVRIRTYGTTTDSVVTAERAADDVTWSPDGTRLVISASGGRGSISWTPTDGRFVNYLATARGDVAWSPDGRTILVAECEGDESGYNGDPDRVGDRRRNESLRATDRLLSIPAPVELAAGSPVASTVSVDRPARNAEAWDRFAQRMRRTYFAGSREKGAAWDAIVARLAPRARAARSDEALEMVMHEAITARPTLRDEATGRAGVSSAHPVATEAGVEMLRRGGNVVDAAVAVSFALGVVEPDASGVGGYGEMLIYQRGMATPALLEFMARVPEDAGLGNATLQENGRYPSDGPVLAMVPGTVAAMHTAWKRHGSGRIPWADLLAPAIQAARDGYVVSDGLATTLWLERDRFAKYESSKALFFRDGKPRVAGDTIRNGDLAWTLEQIARRGADGFYRGDVAQRLVNDLRGKGNAIRLTDLSRYFAADREPVGTGYRGYQVFGSTPPVSGGATLAAQLNSLEQVPQLKPYPEDAASMHAMITAWQLVPTSRNRIADPSLWPVDVSPFTSKDTAKTRWRCFDAAKALTPAAFRGDTLTCAGTAPAAPAESRGNADVPYEPVSPTEPCNVQEHARMSDCRAQGTTSFVVADAEGNAVAVTQTLGTWGGNFYVTPGLGFLYNDKLTSYGTDPNGYNARIPFARHGSTISPTIVLQGEGNERRAAFTAGAAGNAWITSAVYQSVVGMIDGGLSPQRALELPRFLPSQHAGAGGPTATREYVIDVEDGVNPAVMQRLRDMGHRFNVISLKGELRMGYGAAIAIGNGGIRAGADPRRSGAAGAVP